MKGARLKEKAIAVRILLIEKDKRLFERNKRQVRLSVAGSAVLPKVRDLLARWVPVFDVSQTRGRRLPVLDLVVRGQTSHVPALERAATKLGVVITTLRGANDHVGESVGGEIRIRAGLAPSRHNCTAPSRSAPYSASSP